MTPQDVNATNTSTCRGSIRRPVTRSTARRRAAIRNMSGTRRAIGTLIPIIEMESDDE